MRVTPNLVLLVGTFLVLLFLSGCTRAKPVTIREPSHVAPGSGEINPDIDIQEPQPSLSQLPEVVPQPNPTPTAGPQPTPPRIPSPVLSSVVNHTYPAMPLAHGEILRADVNNIQEGGAGSDLGMEYACSFAAPTDGQTYSCSLLPGLVSFNPMNGNLSWVPSKDALGTFGFQITGRNIGGSDIARFLVSVRAKYVSSNLLIDFDAQFADGLGPAAILSPEWKDLTEHTSGGLISGAPRWSSRSLACLELDAESRFVLSDRFDRSSYGVMTWVSPKSALEDSIILGTGGGKGNGFALRQSRTEPGKVELVAGQSHEDVILGFSPVAYWRMNEKSGRTLKDLTEHGFDATLSGTYALGVAGPLVNAPSKGTNFSGAMAVVPTTGELNTRTTLTISAWFNPVSYSYYQPVVIYGKDRWGINIGTSCGSWWGGDMRQVCVGINGINGESKSIYVNPTSFPIQINQWNHVAVTYDGNVVTVYVNGVLADTTVVGSFVLATDEQVNLGYLPTGGACWWWSACAFYGSISEVAIFKAPLNGTQIARIYSAAKGQYGSTCQSNTALEDETWINLAASVDPSRATDGVQLFVNGKKECATGVAFSPAQSKSARAFTVGASPFGERPWPGLLSDLKIYSSFSEEDAQINYEATKQRYQ